MKYIIYAVLSIFLVSLFCLFYTKDLSDEMEADIKKISTVKEIIRMSEEHDFSNIYSFYLMMAHPFRSLAIMLIQLATLAVLLLVPGLAIVLPSASVWASSFLIEQIFLKHMQPADVEKALEEQQTPED